MSRSYQKLVRDKIPEIIKADGKVPVTRILDKSQYIQELIKKLREETDEFADDLSLEELADIQEVVRALLDAIGHSQQELEATRAKKATKNGQFKKRIFLEAVE